MKLTHPRLAALCLFAAGLLNAADIPRVYSWSAKDLAAARERVTSGDAHFKPAADRLLAEADRQMAIPAVSVMDKARTAPSGDKHDYLSQAPYWWPNPADPHGPYIRHDGLRNPERIQGTDFPQWERASSAIETLCLAYYFTGFEPYARHAALQARTWFLNPATRMNPNINYGQYVPGLNQGRSESVLEFRSLIPVTDGLALLAGSPAWTADDEKGMREWLGAYFAWLTTNELAQAEGAAANNHGTWHDAQMAHLALVLGRTNAATALIKEALQSRLARQVEPDGRQPHELARTKSLNYSILNLEGLFNLARLGDATGVDWWGYTTADGRSLHGALAYLAPYADPAKPWPRADLIDADRQRLFPLLAEALRHREDPRFRDALGNAPPAGDARWHLFWPQNLQR